jgi:uncharacterized membrane protein
MLQHYIEAMTKTFETLLGMAGQMWLLYTTVPIFMSLLVIFIARWVLKIFGILKG